MATDKSKSLIMAQRLKYLRNERGLSHESLRDAIEKKYDIRISIDSLKNYEVSSDFHKKAHKNEGMRVEYLRCLADFYDVSADYLLGRTDDRERHPSAIDDLGLSEGTVLWLSALKNFQNTAVLAGANSLFSNSKFHNLLYSIIGYASAIKADQIYDSMREEILSKITKSDLESLSEDEMLSLYTERYQDFFDEIDGVVQSKIYDEMICDHLLLRKKLEETDLPNRESMGLWLDLFTSGARDINGYRINKALSDLLSEIEHSVGISSNN